MTQLNSTIDNIISSGYQPGSTVVLYDYIRLAVVCIACQVDRP